MATQYKAACDKGAQDLEDMVAVRNELQKLVMHCQNTCTEAISAVVTRCLEAVFGASKYKFTLVFEEKRNQTEARCSLVDAAGNEYDPLCGTGGGILDVVTFGLRIACLMLQKPAARKVLILDEPFRFVSKEYRANIMTLLKTLAQETGTQVIMVTHFTEFVDGNVIEIGVSNGR